MEMGGGGRVEGEEESCCRYGEKAMKISKLEGGRARGPLTATMVTTVM